MQTIGTYDAKTKFTALLKRAAEGERITIAKHGVPIATLQAFEGPKSILPVKEVIRELRAFRAAKTLKGLSLRALINEGRR
jgi:prevent-host-death family protein